MIAEIIARALSGRREGRAWRCRCPLHGGRSLLLRDGNGGRLLVTCWAGCDRRQVLAELRARGLLRTDCSATSIKPPRRDDAVHESPRRTRALATWCEAKRIEGTIAERYLRSRAIELDAWPESLRYHSRCPHPSGAVMPAIIALVEHAERGPVAVHRIFLRANGAGKAAIEPRKASIGPVGGGAVRLGMPRHGEWLAIGEGIETTLSVVTACVLPAWAALSANGIATLVLPPEATHLMIIADHDASGVGLRAAHTAAALWLAEGRRVRVAMPPWSDTDFNDILMGALKIRDARYVA